MNDNFMKIVEHVQKTGKAPENPSAYIESIGESNRMHDKNIEVIKQIQKTGKAPKEGMSANVLDMLNDSRQTTVNTVATNKTITDLEKLFEAQPSVLDNYSIYEWRPYIGNCPNCGSANLEYQPWMVLTSNPPKYQCRCKDCGKEFYSDQIKVEPVQMPTLPKEPQTVIPGYVLPNVDKPDHSYGNYGWICPKCGKVNAPHRDFCDCSGGGYYPNIVYCGGSGNNPNPAPTITVSSNTEKENKNG